VTTVRTTGKTGSDIDRIWLKSYPEGVPAEIGPLKFASVAELFKSSCDKYGDKPAFICMGKTLSFTEVDALSADFAAWLQSCNLQKGDRVAIMVPNILQYPIAVAGILRAGLVVVNVNPLYTPRELKHQLEDSGAKAIVVLENFAATVEDVVKDVHLEQVVVTTMGDMLGLKGHVVNFVVRHIKKLVKPWNLPGHKTFKDVLSMGDGRKLQPVDLDVEDIAFLQYTGGTTGVSKGAALSNRNILSNVSQNALWLDVVYRNKGKPDEMTYVCALPLYHIFALTVNCLMGMDQGACNLLIPNPRDLPSFIKELSKYKVHVFPGLNTLFISMMNHKDFSKLDLSTLMLTLGGGMAVQKPVAEEWKKLTGCAIAEGYGLSETSPVATANRFDVTEFSGNIGLPLPSTDIAIRDDEGNDMPLGEVGEICIRGPQVMAGYWQRPEATALVMTEDGFFKSGDLGFMNEEGRTKIVDRKKDMILVSGFNVFPNEIEEAAAEHPGILEAAAIGVADDYSGEVVKLFVVKKDPALTIDDVQAHCKKTMTGYKRPKIIEFMDELPKSNVGKVLRRKLRDA